MRHLLALLLALLLAAAALRAESTDAAGVLEVDTEWRGEILLLEDVIVPRGVTLTIAPGTRIVLEPRARGRGPGWNDERLEIHVAGAIRARGRAENPIRFGYSADDKRAPDADRLWLGLVMLPGRTKTSRFDWCTFENADAALQIAGRHVHLHDCLFRNCTVGIASVLRASASKVGVHYRGESAPTVRRCLFVGCRIGIGAEGQARTDLEQCVFLDCRAGIACATFGDIPHTLSGIGPRIHRSEFVRCDLAIAGSSRVTSSIFERNRLVYATSASHERFTASVDRFLRSHNLYASNLTTTSGDVPLGDGATFVGTTRRGEIPPPDELDALELFKKGAASILALTSGSAGIGSALGGGDVGAFGRRGKATGVTVHKSLPGLILDTWLACGPPGSPFVTESNVMRQRPRPGTADDGGMWVVVRRVGHPVRMPGVALLAVPREPRALVAYVDCTEAQSAVLGVALDGSASGWWNGRELFSRQAGARQLGAETKHTVQLKKGRNRLTLLVVPSRKSARLRVRLIAADGRSPIGTECVRHEPKSRTIRVLSIKRVPPRRHFEFLQIRLSAPVHWADAGNWDNYELLDREGTARPLRGGRIEYDPKKRVITIFSPSFHGEAPYRLRLGLFRDAYGVTQDIPDSSHKIPTR